VGNARNVIQPPVPRRLDLVVLVAASDAPAAVKYRADYVCNGTNDHVEIAAAVAALPASGGVVQLSQGTFYGRFYITKANVTLRGMGKDASWLKLPDATNVPAQVLTVTAAQVTVESLGVDGNRDQQASSGNQRESDGIGIYASHCTVRDCRVWRVRSHGIIVWTEGPLQQLNNAANATIVAGDRDGTRILNNVVVDGGMDGNPRLQIDTATGNNGRRAIINGNMIFGGDFSDGIGLHGARDVAITGNYIENVGSGFVSSFGSRNAAFTGNCMVGIRLRCIRLDDSTLVSVVGNSLESLRNLLTIDGANVSDFSCLGNSFRMVGASGYTPRVIEVPLAGFAIARMMFQGNTFKTEVVVGDRHILFLRGVSTTNGIVFCDNNFVNFSGLTNALETADASGVVYRDNLGEPP